MNKEYKVKLDLNKRLYNKKMTFNQFDENVNDFYIEVTKNNEVVKDLDKAIVTLVAIKPDATVEAQFVQAKSGEIHANLKPSMCDLIGNYQAKAMITLGTEIITTDTINYSVNEDKIISKLNEDVVSDERFTLLTEALSRLSDIESNENTRVSNEVDRLELQSSLEELLREVEEAEVDRKEHEVLREKTHLKMKDTLEEAKDVVSNAIATNTVSSELITSMNSTHDKVLDSYQDVINVKDRVEILETEVSQNEEARQNNESTRQNVFSVKVNEVNNKITEINKAKTDMTTTISNKVKDIDTRFNALTSKQQQDAEVIDARCGYSSLREKIEAMEKSPLILFEDIEG